MTSSESPRDTIQSELREIKERLERVEKQQEELKQQLDDKLDESQYRRELRNMVDHLDSDIAR